MAKNAAWDYFTKVDSDLRKAQCKEYQKLLSIGSDN
jgi:hypothetical protein